jgi:hypothetical protein
VRAIFALPEAVGREAQARVLALDTDQDVQEVARILGIFPATRSIGAQPAGPRPPLDRRGNGAFPT